MTHKVKKAKIKYGRDANRALIRKLVGDFVRYGKLVSTIQRVKIARTEIDRLVGKAREDTNASKKIVLSSLVDQKLVKKLYEATASFSGRIGGYVKTSRLGKRVGDGAELARMEWVVDVTPKEVIKPKSKKQLSPKKDLKAAKPEKKNIKKVNKPKKN